MASTTSPPPQPPALRIASRVHRATIVLELAGEFDLAAGDAVRAALAEAFEKQPEWLVLDLDQVSFMDSTGIHVVLQASKRAESEEVCFVIVPGQRPVQRVFEVCGLLDRLPFAGEAGVR